MILAAVATMALVAQDHASLRAAPRANSTELTTLWQGDVLEIRGEQAGYLKVYNFRLERGGYLRTDSVHAFEMSESQSAELLAVVRFLSTVRGSEALGISYGAAYLKVAPPRALTAEPLDAIGRMAERLADQASDNPRPRTDVAAHIQVVEQFGIHMRSFERQGSIRVCYDGEMFRLVLARPDATAEQRARAALALTRSECIDPEIGPTQRAALDEQRRQTLDMVDMRNLSDGMRARLHARRASVWAALAYAQVRRAEGPAGATAGHALAELQGVRPHDIDEDHRFEYDEAVVRVNAIRWAAASPSPQAGVLVVKLTAAAERGQTCVALEPADRPDALPLAQRCTYGIVWTASALSIPYGPALVLAVQPLESWRELWVFHRRGGSWMIDVVSPGGEDPTEGFVDYAGYVPGQKSLLIAREVKRRGGYQKRFEEIRIDDLTVIQQAGAPELLRNFGRWEDPNWRRDILALH